MDWQASISHLKCHHSGHQAACITHHGGSSLWMLHGPLLHPGGNLQLHSVHLMSCLTHCPSQHCHLLSAPSPGHSWTLHRSLLHTCIAG